MCDWCVAYVGQMEATIDSLDGAQRATRGRSPGAARIGADRSCDATEAAAMIAFKFLRAGRMGPFSGFQWPDAGVWVRPTRTLSRAGAGFTPAASEDLPWWLDDQLWEIELDGEVQWRRHKLLATAGRLVSRVDAWTPTLAQEFGVALRLARSGSTPCGASTGQAGPPRPQSSRPARPSMRSRDRPAAARRRGPDTRISLTMRRGRRLRALYRRATDQRRTSLPTPPGASTARPATRPSGAWQSRWLADRLGLEPEPDCPRLTRRSSS